MNRPTVRFRNDAGEQEDRPMNDDEFTEWTAQVAAFTPDREPTIAEKIESLGIDIPSLKVALGL